MHTDTNIFYILKLVIHRLLKGCRAETYSYGHHNVTYYISVENADYLSVEICPHAFVLHHHQTSYTGISSYKHVHALWTYKCQWEHFILTQQTVAVWATCAVTVNLTFLNHFAVTETWCCF